MLKSETSQFGLLVLTAFAGLVGLILGLLNYRKEQETPISLNFVVIYTILYLLFCLIAFLFLKVYEKNEKPLNNNKSIENKEK